MYLGEETAVQEQDILAGYWSNEQIGTSFRDRVGCYTPGKRWTFFTFAQRVTVRLCSHGVFEE